MGKTRWFASAVLTATTIAAVALARGEASVAPKSVSSVSRGSAATGPTSSQRPSFHADLLTATQDNTAFRRVLFTGQREQLVVMSIAPRTDIGEEVHPHVEQVFYIVSGTGKAIIDGSPSRLSPGDVLIVTPGVPHDVINDGDEPLKLFTIYAPPTHLAGRVHMTRQDAERDHADEQFGASVE